jgi:hypothetical protein
MITRTAAIDGCRPFSCQRDRVGRCSRFGGNATRSLDVAPLVYVARCGAHEAFAECLSGRLNSKLIRASDGDRVAAASA